LTPYFGVECTTSFWFSGCKYNINKCIIQT